MEMGFREAPDSILKKLEQMWRVSGVPLMDATTSQGGVGIEEEALV